MFGGQGAVIFFCFRNLARKVCVSWALSLVECVAVWVLMLTHIQAPHTDVLKTHDITNLFLLNYWNLNKFSPPPCPSNNQKLTAFLEVEVTFFDILTYIDSN